MLIGWICQQMTLKTNTQIFNNHSLYDIDSLQVCSKEILMKSDETSLFLVEVLDPGVFIEMELFWKS